MKSPFPGMDPYLETAEFWSDFHNSLAVEIKVQLNKQIGPKYYANVETYASGESIGIGGIYPDVGVWEQSPPTNITIRNQIAIPAAPLERVVTLPAEGQPKSVRIYATSTHQLVTTIELLSPVNKRADGLLKYQRKRTKILASPVHLLELDLLRGGNRPGHELQQPPLDTDYVLLMNRDQEIGLRVSKIWPLALNEPFPLLPLPLLPPDDDVPLNLESACHTVYEEAGYGWRIDYRQPVPSPALREAMANWLRETLPQVGQLN